MLLRIECTCAYSPTSLVTGHGTVAGDLDAAAYLVPDVGKGDIQVSSLGVELDVGEDVSQLQGAHGVTEVAALEWDAESVSAVDKGSLGWLEVGKATDAEGTVGTVSGDASVKLAEGPEAVEQADSVWVGSVEGWVGEDDVDWDKGDDSGTSWLSVLTGLSVLTVSTILSSGSLLSHGSHGTVSTSGSHRAL